MATYPPTRGQESENSVPNKLELALPRPGECCLQKDHIRQVDIAIPIEISNQAMFSEGLLRFREALGRQQKVSQVHVAVPIKVGG